MSQKPIGDPLTETQELDSTAPAHQLVLAHVQSFDSLNRPVVSFMVAGNSYTISALTTAPLSAEMINRQVALSFIDGDLRKPLILGVIHSPLYDYLQQLELDPASGAMVEEAECEDGVDKPSPLLEPVVVDGRKVTIEAKEMVELRCGEASITLTQNGKIIIRGKYVLNRSSGVNRIVGGSVQVN